VTATTQPTAQSALATDRVDTPRSRAHLLRLGLTDSVAINWLTEGFVIPTPLRQLPSTSMRSAPLTPAATAALQKWLSLGAVRLIHTTPSTAHSTTILCRYFSRPKRNAEVERPILDASLLNQFLPRPPHFQCLGLAYLSARLPKNAFIVTIDLKDAFLRIPLHPQSQSLTRFQAGADLYECTALPFGLSHSPATFTRCLRAVLQPWCQRWPTITIAAYLDDIALSHEQPHTLQLAATELLSHLSESGFPPALHKCQLVPQQQVEWLGLQLDTATMTLSLPDSKLHKIRTAAQQLLAVPPSESTIVSLANLIGQIVFANTALFPALATIRPLIRAQNAALAISNHDYEARMTWTDWSAEQHAALLFWTSPLHTLRLRPLGLPDLDNAVLTLETDASPHSDSARLLLGERLLAETFVRLSDWQRAQSQNWRETAAPLLALAPLSSPINVWLPPHTRLLLVTDSVTHVSYERRQGGRIEKLSRLVEDFHLLLARRYIELVGVRHKAGVLLGDTDLLSRRRAEDRSDWRLQQSFLDEVCVTHRLEVIADCFASSANTLHRVFFSYPLQEPLAYAADILCHGDWPLLFRSLARLQPQPQPPQIRAQQVWYMFPPHLLLATVLPRILAARTPTLLVAPTWPSMDTATSRYLTQATARIAVPPPAITVGPSAHPPSASLLNALAVYIFPFSRQL